MVLLYDIFTYYPVLLILHFVLTLHYNLGIQWKKISLKICNIIYSLPPVAYRVSHVLFTFFVFACVWWCPTHIVLCFCFVCLRLVASFDNIPLVFSNVYFDWANLVKVNSKTRSIHYYIAGSIPLLMSNMINLVHLIIKQTYSVRNSKDRHYNVIC